MSRGAAFDFDLLVVGGGPAGTSTALHLVRREGMRPERIALVDKARFPREKPCAGAISELGVEVLAELGVELTVPSLPMLGVRVLAPGAVGQTERPMGIVVRRSEFDAQLLELVRAEGVSVREGEGVQAIDRVPGGFRVTTSAGTFTSRLLAACDGAGSTTRKLLGVREAERKGHLYVLETKPEPADVGPARGLVDFDLSVLEDGLEGYYWDFPTVIGGELHVSRGIYHANVTPSSDVKASLARHLALRGIDIGQVKLKPFSTRPFVPGAPSWLEGLVLVGEAVGIDRTTGEGIAQAIVMGRIAARHLARAMRTGGTSFAEYGRELFASTVGRHMLQSAWMARRVYGRLGAPARRYLLTSDYARRAAIEWYRGRSLSFFTQLRLAGGLAASVLTRARAVARS